MMKKGDKVQAKKGFYLRNAVVDLVLGDNVQVRHDMRPKKWIGQRPQLGQRGTRFSVSSTFVDIFRRKQLYVWEEGSGAEQMGAA